MHIIYVYALTLNVDVHGVRVDESLSVEGRTIVPAFVFC